MSLSELPAPVFFVLVFVAVLAVIGVTTWLVRRFGAERFGGTTTRNRQPRLAVIDAASVDGRRRLVIIRRDNVEHLLMIGGPTDVVVETNIVRGNAAATAREAPSVRAPSVAETSPRAVPLGESGQWPLQPQPEPSLRPQRTSIADDAGHWSPHPEQPGRQIRMAADDDLHWSLPPQVEASPRAQREASTLAGLEAELSRPAPAELTPAVARLPPEPARAPAPSVAPPTEAVAGDQNLVDMANRLEAALRRPVAAGDSRPAVAPKPPVALDASARIAPNLRARKELEPTPAPVVDLKAERAEPSLAATAEAKPAPDVEAARDEPKPGRAESKFGQPKPAAPKTLYDSLEQEMASLLGRPAGKA